ncbi:MAG: Dabb family protein [Thermodesulfobacteriota bacterium]
MIDRVVLVKLKKEYANPAARAEIARHALDALRPLPGVVSVTAGGPGDAASEASWDVNITIRFASFPDFERYRAHPDHRRFADEYLAPRSEVRKAWSFDVETR